MFNEVPIARSLRLAFHGGLAGLALVGLPALAQTGSSGDIQQGERVEVTGSSIKRIDAETALPVTILTRQDIDRLAPQNVEDLLRSVTSSNPFGGTQLSTGSTATTGGVSTVSLRGLGEQRTLVLVNGRRVAPFGGAQGTPGVDVNSIPLAAIERVEILRDGASAIYGSDAIAGVVNFILRSDFTGALLEGIYGQTTHMGTGKSYSSDVVLGYGDLQRDRFNAMITASWAREAPLFGKDRDYSRTTIDLSNGYDGTSGNTFPANIVNAAGGTRNFLAGIYAPQRAAGIYPTFGLDSCAPGVEASPLISATQRVCRYDPSQEVTLIPGSLRTAVGFSGQFAVTPDITAYGEANAQHNVVKYRIQPAPISDLFVLQDNNPYTPAQAAFLNANRAGLEAGYGGSGVFDNGVDPIGALFGKDTFILLPSSPYYPAAFATALGLGGLPLDLRYRSYALGGRALKDVNDSDRFVAGVKGTFYNFDFDVGVLYTQARTREILTDGYSLYSQLLPLLNTGTVNPFGPSTPAVQQQLDQTKYFGQAYESQTSLLGLNARVSRDVYNLPAGPIGIALGGEVRREEYKLKAASGLQTGDISGYGGNFLDQGDYRNVEAGFFEVNVPLIKGLEINGSGRYDNYEFVGNTFNPKVSLRWQPAKEFLARAAWGHGFRAPSLTDVSAPVTLGVTGVTSDPLRCIDPTTTPADCNVQFSQVNGGNRNLKPERSISRNFGFVLEPVSAVHLGVDYFDTIVRDSIGVITVDQILNNLPKYGFLVTRGPSQDGGVTPGPILSINQQLQNTNNLHVSGFDTDLKVRFDAPVGHVTAGLTGTYISRYDIQSDDGSYTGVIANAGNAGGVVPRWKHVASVGYDYGPFSGTIVQNFQTAYIDYDAFRRVGAYELYDVLASYNGIKGLTITLGVKNIFDRDPPYSIAGEVGAQFASGYDVSVGDPRGRFIYGKISYLFK